MSLTPSQIAEIVPVREMQPERPDPQSPDPRHLAHDARNWLTALQVYCDLLRSPGAVAHPYQPWIEELSGAVERGKGLVLSLLDSLQPPAHSDAGSVHGPEAEKTAVDIGAVLTRQLPLFRHLAGDNIQVEVDAPEQLGNARLGEETLERILQNLVHNAIEAMPRGGRLRVYARHSSRGHSRRVQGRNARGRSTRERNTKGGNAKKPSILLRVSDTGTGIAPELLPRIFEAGVSGKTGKNRRGNRGFGLAIVRELVEQAGGTVQAHSRAGQGACFEVMLPRA
jgi:signal transduction histidine kinase